MKNGMKISFFGSSLLSAYWNGAATYYRGVIKELSNRGYKVTFYEPDIYDRQKHRDIAMPSYAECIVYKPQISDLNICLDKAKDSDIIVKTSGIGIFDEFLEAEVLNVKKNGTIIFWDVDAPATLERIGKNSDDPFIKLIPLYDKILTYGGGNPVVNAYTSFGAKECVPIYNALDPQTHFQVQPEPKFKATLGFLGNRLPDREDRVKEFFFSSASALEDKTFVLGGNGWESNAPELKNVKKLGHVYTTEHNAFYSSTLATLNINRNSMATYGYSPPTRVFEAAGTGACLICDAWEGIEQFLTPGSECLVAQSGKDVANYLKELNGCDARKIGNAARQRILSEHTYKHRADLIERIL